MSELVSELVSDLAIEIGAYQCDPSINTSPSSYKEGLFEANLAEYLLVVEHLCEVLTRIVETSCRGK